MTNPGACGGESLHPIATVAGGLKIRKKERAAPAEAAPPLTPSLSPRAGKGGVKERSGVPAEGLLLALRALAQLDVDEAGAREAHQLIERVADILRVLDI